MMKRYGTMHEGKNGKPQSRGADRGTGAGMANEPAKRVRNLAHSKQKNMKQTRGGW